MYIAVTAMPMCTDFRWRTEDRAQITQAPRARNDQSETAGFPQLSNFSSRLGPHA